MKKKEKKVSYTYCEYCGKKCIDQLMSNTFDKFTGKQSLWLVCPSYEYEDEHRKGHSRWVKDYVTDIDPDE